jgi:hypothetical protein
MSEVLWLVFERVPHPEAVCYAADEGDARLALNLLNSPRVERMQYAEQLRNYLRQQAGLSPFARPGVACREGAGLFRVISWRFAKWLANVLPAEGTVAEGVRGRIEAWLARRVTPGEADGWLGRELFRSTPR